MGRSIPSFRMLIDIEQLEWRIFKDRLSSRKDKESFNKLFSVPKLYCHSLSNLSNPIIIEPILLSVLFQSFKEVSNLVDKSRKSTNNEKYCYVKYQSNIKKTSYDNFPIINEVWNRDCQYSQILEDWKEFSACLNKEDESNFIDMITNCYNSYHRSINSYNNSNIYNNKFSNDKKSGSCLNRINSLFMALFLYQQRQLNMIKSNQRLLDSYY